MRYTLLFIVLQIKTFVESCFVIYCAEYASGVRNLYCLGDFVLPGRNEIHGTKLLFHVIDFYNFCNKIFFDFSDYDFDKFFFRMG